MLLGYNSKGSIASTKPIEKPKASFTQVFKKAPVVKEQPREVDKTLSFSELLSALKDKNKYSGVEKVISAIEKEHAAILSAQKSKSSLYTQRVWSGFIKFLTANQISAWPLKEVEEWAVFVKKREKARKTRKYLPEAVAVIMRTVELTMGYKPNDAQLIALLALLNKEKAQGRILEMATGDGKSTISVMLATILALKGEKVDIIYNSPESAEQHAHKWKPYFQVFPFTVDYKTNEKVKQIKVDSNTDNKLNETEMDSSEKKSGILQNITNSAADILFVDLSTYQTYILANEYLEKDKRNTRPFENAIVMEAGAMMVDGIDEIYMLPNFISGSEHFVHILMDGRERMKELESALKLKSPAKFGALTNTLQQHFEEVVEEGFAVPNYLKSFAKSQTANLARGVIKANLMQPDCDYFLCNNKKTIRLDHCTATGRRKWEQVVQYGLLQFLQLKHKLAVSNAEFPQTFISNTDYFAQYQEKVGSDGQIITASNNLYGFTDALGSVDSQKNIHWIYDVDFLSIPSSRPRMFSESAGIVAQNNEGYLEGVKDTVFNKIKEGNAVLVVCRNPASVELIFKYLQEQITSTKSTIDLRKIDTDDEKEDETQEKDVNDQGKDKKLQTDNKKDLDVHGKPAVKEQMKPKKIVVTTFLQMKSIEKKVDEQVKLHICVTFLPENLRIEHIALGKSYWQSSETISNQLIVNKIDVQKQLDTHFPKKDVLDIKSIKIRRDLKEREKNKKYGAVTFKNRTLLERLCQSFNEFVEEIRRANQAGYKTKKENFEQRIFEEKDKYTQRTQEEKDRVTEELYAASQPLLNHGNKSKNNLKYDQMKELWTLKLVEYQSTMQTSLDPEKTRKSIQEDFQLFLDEIKKDCQKGEQFYKNPAFLVKDAMSTAFRKSLTMDDAAEKYKEANYMLSLAIHIEPRFAMPALYARAVVTILESRRKGGDKQQMAIFQYEEAEDFRGALQALDKIYLPILFSPAFYAHKPDFNIEQLIKNQKPSIEISKVYNSLGEPENELDRQIKARNMLYMNFYLNIQQALDIINQCKKKEEGEKCFTNVCRERVEAQKCALQIRSQHVLRILETVSPNYNEVNQLDSSGLSSIFLWKGLVLDFFMKVKNGLIK